MSDPIDKPDSTPGTKPRPALRWGPVLSIALIGTAATLVVLRRQSELRPVEVSGVVRLDGAPLTSGVVNFRAIDPEKGSYAMGVIGADGRYIADSPHVGAGILPGVYRVGVLAQVDATKFTREEYDALVGPGKPGIPSLVPQSMTDPETSGLRVTVAGPGPQTFDIDIPAEGGKTDRSAE